ncbi:MAG: type II secretion system F family protein [Acidobacteriota bacterium]
MEFVCRLGTPDGRIRTEVQNSSDAGALRRELERQGFHIFEIKPKGFALSFDLPALFRGRAKLSDEEFLAFNRELAALLRAGLPLLQGLDMMLERMTDDRLRDVMTDIRDQVKSGADLSEAFASHGDTFPPLYAATLKAGERSGELEQVIRRFMRYQKLILDARKKVVSAMVYPVVLVVLSVIILSVLLIYVVPRFTAFYGDLDAQLPALTQGTLAVAFFLRDYGWLVGLVLVAAFFGLRLWVRTPKGRVTVDGWRLRLPLVGIIFRDFGLSEFCRSVSTLLAGGLPLLTSLQIGIDAIGNHWLRKKLEPSIDGVRQGGAFHEALDQASVFPPIGVDMIKVGEATGELDEMLSSTADYFDDQSEVRTARLLSLVEPLMLVIMGFIVATILISIYLPMFSVIGQVR